MGAGLPAMAVVQALFLVADKPSSQASQLPHWFVACPEFPAWSSPPLWERACPRWPQGRC
ncbi:hypothetical protein D7M10_00990 [Pseudomonas fluorescens]|nr:hypothetical protein D7M10_00990 [Pseudomonas fluorescens]